MISRPTSAAGRAATALGALWFASICAVVLYNRYDYGSDLNSFEDVIFWGLVPILAAASVAVAFWVLDRIGRRLLVAAILIGAMGAGGAYGYQAYTRYSREQSQKRLQRERKNCLKQHYAPTCAAEGKPDAPAPRFLLNAYDECMLKYEWREDRGELTNCPKAQ